MRPYLSVSEARRELDFALRGRFHSARWEWRTMGGTRFAAGTFGDHGSVFDEIEHERDGFTAILTVHAEGIEPRSWTVENMR